MMGRGDGLPGGARGRDAVARSLRCFERAAALAKTHMEVRQLSYTLPILS